ncbi:histidine kinase [Nostoc sp. FACHB-857]|nr:histidine kinase [Nostoc sp. FACHB-857]
MWGMWEDGEDFFCRVFPHLSMPNAQCPMPNAQCPMPNAQCPMPKN